MSMRQNPTLVGGYPYRTERGYGSDRANILPVSRTPWTPAWPVWLLSVLARHLVGAEVAKARSFLSCTPKIELEIVAPCSFRGTKNLKKN
jgi:hypothetical protein